LFYQEILAKKAHGPDMVVHAFNPSYSGDGNQKGSQLEACIGRKLARPYLNQQAKYGGTSTYTGGYVLVGRSQSSEDRRDPI
jgi:hypothetical protein